MREVVVPRLNSNDDSCTLVEWLSADGADVGEQDPIAVVETAKATSDIYSDAAGVVHAVVEAGVECRVGEVIGYVFPDEAGRQEFLRSKGGLVERPSSDGPAPVLTDAARRLSELNGVSDAKLRSLGKRIIRESDVEALVSARPVGVSPLSARQRAIGQVVSRSHRSVPDAFVAVKVRCDELLEHLRGANERYGGMVGIPEVAITALAGLRERFQVFFSSLRDEEGLVEPAPETNIGVTVDLGKGLFVPVLKDVGGRSAWEVADRLMELRVKALRDSFQEDDLSGGQLSVSLNTDADVLFALPIILAPQVCMVSIGSTQTELVLDDAGQVRQRSHFIAGLTYDHRVINGYDAVEFLTAFKDAVERLEEVRL